MKVEILKDHESGLLKGQIKNLSVQDARAIIEMGIAKYADGEETPIEKPKKVKKSK
jgi:hypothetical protein